jgi:hypothetical protein
MKNLRLLLLTLLMVGCAASIAMVQGPMGPLDTRVGFADDSAALKVVSVGACGTLGPAGPLGTRVVRTDANGALQVCGVTGGSGDVSTDTIWAAAGDIVQADGNDSAVVLSIGTALQILQVNAGATALEYTSVITALAAITGAVDLGGASSFEVPNGAAPTVNADGEIAFDTDAQGAARGALRIWDGTAVTFGVATLAADTPANGQVPKWNTGGTITWEDDSTGSGSLGANLTSATNDITSDNEIITLAGTTENLILTFTSNVGTFTSSTSLTSLVFTAITLTVPDEAYDDTGWNGDLTVPTKNAIRDYLATFATLDADPGADVLIGWDNTGNQFTDASAFDGVLNSLTLGAAASAADAGAIRLANAATIAWEADVASTDLTLTVNSSEQFVFSAPILSPTLVTPALGTPASGTLNLSFHMIFLTGVCQNATASSGLSTATTLGGSAVCTTTTAASGDTAYAGVSFLTGGSNTEVHGHFPLPSDWTGAIDVQLKWRATDTTANDVVFQIKFGCVATGEATTSISLNNTAFAAVTNLGTTLQWNVATKTGITTTGCAADEQAFFILDRDTDTAGDTLDADVQVFSIDFTYRRAVVIGG